jgi:hypothetical protein
MTHQEEVTNGIALIEGGAQSCGCTLTYRPMGLREVYYFELRRGENVIDFTLSEEFLSDLPGTASHQQHLREALVGFSNRLRNRSASDFYTMSGTPFNLNVFWPLKRHPSRDVVWLHADLEDLRYPDFVAKVAAVIFGGVEHSEFKFKPFNRIAAIVDAIRTALDNSQLQFFRRGEHPENLQEVEIPDLPRHPRISDEGVEQFVAAKVYWLGFKRGDKTAQVWVADPWDASYLGVGVRELVQSAQVSQARGLIKLSADSQFANAEDALILRQRQTESVPRKRRIGFV